MTTIQNYRDLELQATTPRVVATGSDYINLTSSYQIFRVNTLGNPTPDTINITASLVGNLRGTVTFSVVDGSGTLVPDGNSCSISYSNMLTDTITIKASLDYLGLTYDSTYTISKVYDGAQGEPGESGVSAVIADLLSEADVVFANNDGTGYTLPTGNAVRLYVGNVQQTQDVTYGISGSSTKNGLTASINSSGNISLSGTSWTSDTESFVFTATYALVVYETVYTVSKSKMGATGASAQYCSLAVNNQAITYAADGTTPSPTTTTLTATATNITTPYYEFVIAGVAKQNTTTDTYTYTVPTSYANMPQQVVVNVRSGGSTGTILATDTLALIGIKPGASGTSGAAALQLLVSNEAHVFPADSSGNVTSYTGSGTQIKMYEGATLMTYDGVGTTAGTYKISYTYTNITVGSASLVSGYIVIADASGVAAGVDASSIVWNITGTTSAGTPFTISKTQSFSKSKSGAAGSDAVIPDLISEVDVIPALNDGTGYTLPTADSNALRLYKGGSILASGVTYAVWNGSAWATTATFTGLTLTINASTGVFSLTGASWTSASVSFSLRATYATVNYQSTYKITKALVGATGATGATGSTGAAGNSYRICYLATNSTISTSSTITTSGNSSYPSSAQSSASWGVAGTWVATPPTLSTGQILYQSDGVYSVSTNQTVWNPPYMSSLKVGSLDAISATLGTITSGTITSGTFQTAASGNTRIAIAAATNDMTVYAGSATAFIKMGGTQNNKLFINTTGSSIYPDVYVTNTGTVSGIYVTSTYNNGSRVAFAGLYGTSVSNDGVAGYSDYGYGVIGQINTSSPSSSAGVNGIAYGNGIGCAGTAKGTASTNHGLRGAKESNGTSGLVGVANGYDFYADGAGTNYGPFTGSHDVLFNPQETVELGDIVVDQECILKSNISTAITLVTKSTEPNQKGTVGVVSRIRGYLRNEYPPTVFDMTNNQVVDDYGNTTSPHTSIYEYCCDNYYYHSINALGEGQINVCGENGDLETGDLIVSSSIPGKGMRQSDDIIRSYTVAKVREPVVFDYPTQVKMVACIYLCG